MPHNTPESPDEDEPTANEDTGGGSMAPPSPQQHIAASEVQDEPRWIPRFHLLVLLYASTTEKVIARVVLETQMKFASG